MRAVGRNLRALETFARYLLDPTTQKFRKEAATKQNNYINVKSGIGHSINNSNDNNINNNDDSINNNDNNE